MNKHRYILEPYKGMKSRYRCPQCNYKDRTFSRYIDTETGQHLADHVGRCERLDKCGYHYTPKQYFLDNSIRFDMPKQNTYKDPKKRVSEAIKKEVSFIPVPEFTSTLKGHESNNLVCYLYSLFGSEETTKLIERYFIGTSGHWDGSTVFWQIDNKGKVRTGKIMLYNANAGKRVKEPFNHITWVHTVLKNPDFKLQQCFFGEHLLINNIKPVAIVESEKTAVIASVYLPQFIWLAAGSKEGLNIEKCRVLQGRKVTLFPDLNGFDKWSSKAEQLKDIVNHISVSDLLERKATDLEKLQGCDLADYLVRFDYKLFNTHQMATTKLSGMDVLINNITSTPCETVIPKAYGGFKMLYVRTECGSYDVLFDKDMKPVKEKTAQVKELENLFDKCFKPALLDGCECLAHIVT